MEYITIKIPVRPRPFSLGITMKEIKDIVYKVVCTEALRRSEGNRSVASKNLDINRNTFYKRYGKKIYDEK